MLKKYAEMERRLQDQVFDITDERNAYKGELEHFYSLPNPCGVGLGINVTVSADGSSAASIIDIVPGMSAALCGMINVGDEVLSIDGMSAYGKSTDELKSIISGKRGTRVQVAFRRGMDHSEYTLILKRGAWGPEHAVVSPEHMDMHDQGRWPEVKARTADNRSLTNGSYTSSLPDRNY
jgi:C-terminal processing protease CtpA/Prc